MAQGGWADSKTIFKHYRLMDEERHYAGVERTFAPPKPSGRDEDDPAFR